MKRRVGLFLFCVYLFTATPFNQLLKVPVLTMHFKEHVEWSEGLSFYQFLCMHYAGDDLRDDDQQQDSGLPFKGADHCGLAVSVCPVNDFSVPLPREYEGTVLSVHQNNRFQPTFSAFVWQPPEG